MNLMNYRSHAPSVNTIGNYLKSQELTTGREPVRIAKMSLTDSFSNFDGSPRNAEDLPEWDDPTVQLAVTFASTDGHGVHTHRFNLQGFKPWDTLTEKEQKSDDFVQLGKYACKKNKRGQLVRLPDKDKSATAVGMLDQLFSAVQLPLGSSVYAKDGQDPDGNPVPENSLEGSIAKATVMNITLRYDEEFSNWEVTSFGKVTAEEPEKAKAEF